MPSFIETQEKILEVQVKNRLAFLEYMYGLQCNVYKIKKNVFSSVYGKESGEEMSSPKPLRLLVTTDTFSPADNNTAGTMTEGWIYSKSEELTVGDRVEVVRADGRNRHYKIDNVFILGSTTQVIKKFKIVSIGN